MSWLQIAGVPPSNIKLYWEQIAQSATKWEEVKKLERNFLSHNRILGNASPRASNSSRPVPIAVALWPALARSPCPALPCPFVHGAARGTAAA